MITDDTEAWEDWVDDPTSDLNRRMAKAAFHHAKVKITDQEGNQYEGRVGFYFRAGSEDARMLTVDLEQEGEEGEWCFKQSEIRELEILSED